ncbi:MurR/RpiR family transcriptional regulator [Rhizobiales bacterium]|uniref:MurR/RpiR family transcriptional regulator n=1 Tax=Hongsoonwoonella zoysiae TaxID=2821844 RepID=UPI00156030CA|nr:MurR/RpiR family transcriptional regulator [Hongsoonwoonella zoysiae]NRG16250.1 MurR/RpiR family transcriptional regulator [Hongsoonwoonella zoysiae]
MSEQTPLQAAPGSVSELLEKLDGTIDGLPKRLKQCASFTRRHLHLVAVSTVSEMAGASGVAPSVYMRFCQALGFSGYSEMQDLFRARYTEFRPNYEERLANLREEGAIGTGRLLADFAESGHKSLISLANTVTTDRLDRIARGMASARVVHLVGLRRAFAVVSSMSYLFDKLGVAANLHYGAGMLNTAGTIFPEDALFAVTYAPFSEETVRLAETTAKQGITVFGLTDSERCPIAEWASEMLIAREDEVAGFRALNASITLTTTLAVAVGALQKRS